MDECISTEFRCRVRSGLKCEHAGFWSGSRMRSAGELCGTFSHFINLRKNCKRGERKGKHTPWCDGWDGIEGQTKGRCFETPLTTRCIFYMDWLNCNNMFWWMLWRLQGICFFISPHSSFTNLRSPAPLLRCPLLCRQNTEFSLQRYARSPSVANSFTLVP